MAVSEFIDEGSIWTAKGEVNRRRASVHAKVEEGTMYIEINGSPACEQHRLVDAALAKYERSHRMHHGNWPPAWPPEVHLCTQVSHDRAMAAVEFLCNVLGFKARLIVGVECPAGRLQDTRLEAGYSW